MSEQEATGVAEQEEEKFQYPVTIEDVGPAAKKVTVEIPRDRIDSKLQEQFKELRQQAAIPGFRVGHAPQKLIEKRFSQDVKDQVRRALISESYEQAVEKNSLQVIGEPEFEKEDDIKKLPDEGPLQYSFEVEVQPQFELPDLSNLTVKRPRILITDENIDQAMQNLREQQGALVPVEDRGVEEKDYLTADVHVKGDGNVLVHQHDAQLVARPGRVGGIQIDDLDKQLAGMRVGETRTIRAKASDAHADEQLRGKDVEIEVTLKDLKRLELVEVNERFLNDLGFQTEQELRDALRDQMEHKVEEDVRRAMRDQINRYLLQNTRIELPSKLSEKQENRVVSRRAVDLLIRGTPRDQVEANLEQLRSGAKDEAVRELKLFFILQKVAADQNVEVSEAELNGRVATVAAQEGRRPEKVKQEWSKDGTLANVYIQMREQKAVDRILSKARIEEVELDSQVPAEAQVDQAPPPEQASQPEQTPPPQG